MSKLFKKIKSAFIVEEEVGKKVTKTAAKSDDRPQTTDDASIQIPQEENAPVYDGGEGEVSDKFTHILFKALEASNQEGFDYIEFKRSVQNLKNLEEDTGKTYEIAYATARTMGATPQGLINSAERYLTVLAREQEKFNRALEKQRAKQIDGKAKELKQVESMIAEKKERIAQLKEEIKTHEESLGKLSGSIQSATGKLQTTGNDFEASYSHLVQQIRKDIENIGKYLS